MKKIALRILTLALALVMLTAVTVHAEAVQEYQQTIIMNALFPNQADLDKMYADEDIQAVFCGAAVCDVMLFGKLIDSEKLLKMIQHDEVYLIQLNNGGFMLQIYDTMGDFRIFYNAGSETNLANYESSTMISNPSPVMDGLIAENPIFVSYTKIPALNVLTAANVVLQALQGE